MNKYNDEDVVYCEVKDENKYQQCTQYREPASYISLKSSNFDRFKGRSKDRKWKILASILLIGSFLLTCTTVGLCILLVAEHYRNCNDNICFPVQCENGGSCYVSGKSPVCVCTVGYTGHTCNVSVCSSSPCKHGGRCEAEIGGFRCECKNGFSGYACEISPCQRSPCKNGGTCTMTDYGFSCLCPSGRYGEFCENYCQKKPCLDGWLFSDTFFACYFIGLTNKSWSTANDTCASMDSCLSTIWSLDEARWIGNLTQGGTWTGGRQVRDQYGWYCGKNNYENVINQALWAQGEPTRNGKCVQLWKEKQYMLDDDHCEYLKKFVCKAKMCW